MPNMIAMQYSFVLPADYDMSIIDKRISAKGPALDGHTPLVFKAYCSARAGSQQTGGAENIYAPFYLWHGNEGMADFLAGDGFKGLVRSFGWPAIKVWPLVLAAEMGDLRQARFATREMISIKPFTPLETLREGARTTARQQVSSGAAGVVIAYEPTAWTMVQYTAWPSPVQSTSEGIVQAYDVQHVSQPGLHLR